MKLYHHSPKGLTGKSGRENWGIFRYTHLKAEDISSMNKIKGIMMKKYFEEKFGEGTAFDLDYGKLLILALLIYIAFFK